MKRTGSPMIKIPETEMLEMYLTKKMSVTQISKYFNCGRMTVARRLESLNVIIRGPGGYRAQNRSNNIQWKGEQVGYTAAHARVMKERGKPTNCEECGENDPSLKYEWASLSKNYTDVNDYKRMCVKCHRSFDSDRVRKERREIKNSTKSKIFELLEESPRTAREIGSIMYPDLDSSTQLRKASQHLCRWNNTGELKVVGRAKRIGEHQGEKGMAYIFAVNEETKIPKP